MREFIRLSDFHLISLKMPYDALLTASVSSKHQCNLCNSPKMNFSCQSIYLIKVRVIVQKNCTGCLAMQYDRGAAGDSLSFNAQTEKNCIEIYMFIRLNIVYPLPTYLLSDESKSLCPMFTQCIKEWDERVLDIRIHTVREQPTCCNGTNKYR